MKTLVTWRGCLFLTEEKIGLLSVSFLFLTWVGVYVSVCEVTIAFIIAQKEIM